jgi:glycosyltransferase involved in cell wall biosynthesis
VQSKRKNQKIISHFVGLSGVGGVQSNFVEYMKNIESHSSRYQHKIYTIGSVDVHYQLVSDVLDIRKISNLYRLILDVVSRNVIVHFYNNLSSFKVAFFLFFLPVNKLIVHERGTIWNQKSTGWLVPRFVAWKASIVLSNSVATKTMLVKKISIPEKKIRVLHNGINTSINFDCSNDNKKNSSIFSIGFIGRLDSPKGVHVLINAMYHLRNKNIKLVIAGEGVLEHMLKKNAAKLNNVQFIGRVKNPYLFMNKVSLLVVPSIREPLGNVCLEAGLCKVPVLATNVDGLPEIIENGISGELIDATDQISIDLPEGSIPLPEFVVNPDIYELQPPKQINSSLLAKKILELSMSPDKLKYYADNLHNKVTKYFNIHRYRTDLHKIYSEIYFMDNF